MAWQGWRVQLNCGHFFLNSEKREVGELSACRVCPPRAKGVAGPVAQVSQIVGCDSVSAAKQPAYWGSEHWYPGRPR